MDLWSVTWKCEIFLGRRRNIIYSNICWDPKVVYLICIYVYIYTIYVSYHISNWYGRIIWIIYFLGSWPKKSQEVAQLIYFCSFINWVSPSDRSSSSFAQAGVTLIQLLTGQHLIPGSLQKWMLVFFWGGVGVWVLHHSYPPRKGGFFGPMINLWEMAIAIDPGTPGVCFIGGVGTGVTRYLETNSWKKPDWRLVVGSDDLSWRVEDIEGPIFRGRSVSFRGAYLLLNCIMICMLEFERQQCFWF